MMVLGRCCNGNSVPGLGVVTGGCRSGVVIVRWVEIGLVRVG